MESAGTSTRGRFPAAEEEALDEGTKALEEEDAVVNAIEDAAGGNKLAEGTTDAAEEEAMVVDVAMEVMEEEAAAVVVDMAMEEIEAADSRGVPGAHATIAKPLRVARAFSSATCRLNSLVVWPPEYHLRLSASAASTSCQ